MIRTKFLSAVIGASFLLGMAHSLETAGLGLDASASVPQRGADQVLPTTSLVYTAAPEQLELTAAALPPADPFAAGDLADAPLDALTLGADPASRFEFMRQASMSARLEIRASEIALRVSDDPAARVAARAIERDAVARLRELRAIARDLDATMAVEAFDAWHASQITQMRHGEANGIDHAYADLVADSRAKELRFAALYAREGEDPELREWAGERLRALRSEAALTTG